MFRKLAAKQKLQTTNLFLLKLFVELLESVVSREEFIQTRQNLPMDLDEFLVDGKYNHVLEHDVADALDLVAAVLPHDDAVFQVAKEDRVMLHHRFEVVEEWLQAVDVFGAKCLAESLEKRSS